MGEDVCTAISALSLQQRRVRSSLETGGVTWLTHASVCGGIVGETVAGLRVYSSSDDIQFRGLMVG